MSSKAKSISRDSPFSEARVSGSTGVVSALRSSLSWLAVQKKKFQLLDNPKVLVQCRADSQDQPCVAEPRFNSNHYVKGSW